MSAHLKFKKSALYVSMSSMLEWKHAKTLYIGLFLSFISHQSFAEELRNPQNETKGIEHTQTVINASDSQQLTTNIPQQASEKVEIPKLDEDIPNSMEMLHHQLQNSHEINEFQNIDLNDLEPLPSFDIDQSMVNEIYSVADEAKKEALAYRENQKGEVTVNDATKQELAEINVAPVNIDHLMSTIQSESKIIVDANETGATLGDLSLDPDLIDEPKKLNVFKRILYSIRPPKDAENAPAARITAHVHLVDDGRTKKLDKKEIAAQQKLKANIEAKLSSYTVEVFEDYSAAVPQLRALSKDAAQAVGFYNAVFHFEKTGKASVDVFVEPNDPVIVDKQDIVFTGAGAILPQFQVIGILPDLQVGDVLNQGLYTKTKDRITEAASNNGFFDSFWRIHDVQVFQPENDAAINLKFETGDRYKLGPAEFVMSDPSKEIPLDRDVLEKMVPWEAGQDYALWRVTGLVNNLTNSRYFNYTLVDTIIPDPVETPLEITPDIQALLNEEGASDDLQAQLSKPDTISSKKEVTQNVVNEAEFAGTTQSLGKSRSKAEDTMLEDEQTEVEKKARNELLRTQARADKTIPVLVTLNADRLNSAEVGVGYGSDTGFRLRSQYRRAIVNKRGHSFDANMELSQIRQAIEGKYNIPFNHPLNDYFRLVAGYEREERNNVSDNGDLLIEAGVIGLDRIIKNPRGNWQHTFSSRYRLDRLSSRNGLFDEDDIPDWFYANARTQQESLLLGYEISRVDSDKRINPTQGFSQNYKIELGSKSFLSDADMAIVNAGWKFLYSYGENKNNQILGRANLGYIFTNDFTSVPYNLRYFAGGDQTIRGFDYKSLSPEEFGFKIGGQALAIGSLEYNYQFMEGWRAAVFSDFGNAYDKQFNNPTAYSIGVGLRWASPIGPIRIDLASGISDKEDTPIRLHFFVGPQI
jgi:translocation and assembly module TamA